MAVNILGLHFGGPGLDLRPDAKYPEIFFKYVIQFFDARQTIASSESARSNKKACKLVCNI
jgi:hypothetical protein